MRTIIGCLLSLIGRIIPTTNILLFHSYPDYSDNSYAFFRYLQLNGACTKYRFYWLIDDDKSIVKGKMKKEGFRAKTISRKSLYAYWLFIRARFVFSTHGLFDYIHLKQHDNKVINFWHGMPLKLIGASHPNGISASNNFDYLVATSKLYQGIMAEAFACPEAKVLVTGQPRCDLLYEKTDWFDIHSIDINQYKSVGIWMPTYRKSVDGEIRLDGTYIEKCISFLTEKQIYDLDVFLRDNNILLLVKIHPMDALQNEDFSEFSNIIFIKPHDFRSQLYPLLGCCDFLLTDYSSVFIDYQILRRPIGFVMNDIDSYKNSRGLYFDNLSEVLPGPILNSFDLLCDFINKPQVLESSICYNEFYDSFACKRVNQYLHII